MKYETPTMEILRYAVEDILSGPSVDEEPNKIPDTQEIDAFGDL